jgi:hypothetical protein
MQGNVTQVVREFLEVHSRAVIVNIRRCSNHLGLSKSTLYIDISLENNNVNVRNDYGFISRLSS